MTFGLLDVEQTLKGNDIGGILMRETIKLAKESGVAKIALRGEQGYYYRVGFRRESEFGITDTFRDNPDTLMVLPMNDDFFSVKGRPIESADLY